MDDLVIHAAGEVECTPEWMWDTGEGFADHDLWTVFGGRGEIAGHGVTVPVSAGSSVMLSPGTHYRATHDPARPLSVMFVHFGANSGQPLPDVPLPAAARRVDNTGFYRDLLRRVVKAQHENRPTDAARWFRCAMLEYLASPESMPEAIDARWRDTIQTVCAQVQQQPRKAPPLKQLAGRLGYSPDHISRMFRQFTGLNYQQYVMRARVNQTQTLLLTTSSPLSAIAESLGYYDAAAFSRQFRKVHGMTPGTYRSMLSARPQG